MSTSQEQRLRAIAQRHLDAVQTQAEEMAQWLAKNIDAMYADEEELAEALSEAAEVADAMAIHLRTAALRILGVEPREELDDQ